MSGIAISSSNESKMLLLSIARMIGVWLRPPMNRLLRFMEPYVDRGTRVLNLSIVILFACLLVVHLHEEYKQVLQQEFQESRIAALERDREAEAFLDRHPEAIKALTLNTYFEAENQTEEGMRATIATVFTRVAMENFPNSIPEVIYQTRTITSKKSKKRKKVAQYSWVADGKSDKPARVAELLKIHLLVRTVLKEMYLGTFIDPTDGAHSYHKVGAKMSKKSRAYFGRLKYTRTVGDHKFYRSPEQVVKNVIQLANN